MSPMQSALEAIGTEFEELEIREVTQVNKDTVTFQVYDKEDADEDDTGLECTISVIPETTLVSISVRTSTDIPRRFLGPVLYLINEGAHKLPRSTVGTLSVVGLDARDDRPLSFDYSWTVNAPEGTQNSVLKQAISRLLSENEELMIPLYNIIAGSDLH